MKILDFVKDFREKKIMNTTIKPNAVEEYIRETLDIVDYLPFTEKRNLCVVVLNGCNSVDENNGMIRVDSVSRYILFVTTILTAYTNLEFTYNEEGDTLDDYDMLCASGLLNPILSIIEAEYTACNNMLNMMMSDLIENNNTIENVIGNLGNKLLNNIDVLINALANKVDAMNFDMSQLNLEPYKELIGLLPKK